MRTPRRGHSCRLIDQRLPKRASYKAQVCVVWLSVLAYAMATPSLAFGAPLSREAFDSLASKCAPGISLAALEAVAAKESRFDPLALHNNTRKLTIYARDPSAAVQQASIWMKDGESVDLGLMQIHTSNLSPLKLTLARAFDPCASLEAGAEILRAAYVKGATPAEREAALLIAYSRYNTGRTLDGIVNGYAPDVVMRTNQDQALVRTPEQPPADSTPANWDVWAAGSRSNQPLPWFSDYSASHPPVLLVGTPTSAQPSTAGD